MGNVVTGIVCEQVLTLASRMPPPTADHFEQKRDEFKDHIKRIFDRADVNRTNAVPISECLRILRTADMREILEDMEVLLPLTQRQMIIMLDEDHNGSLSFEEFVVGLMRLRGTRCDT